MNHASVPSDPSVLPGARIPLADQAGPALVDHAALTAVLDEFSATVSGDFAVADLLAQLARAATRVLDIDGAGVMVSRGGDLLRSTFATAAPVQDLGRLQELLQEGPCRDSHASGKLLNIADLAVEGSWPPFQDRAVELGLRAVTAIPLRARGRAWGVLDVYRTRPVALSDAELSAATTLANLATSYLLVTADRDTARRAQEELAHRAMYDPLTGLPVRWVFLEQLQHALVRLHRHPGFVGVLFCDLDGLKYVNDTWGHLAGDALIATCATRIKAALRPSDVVARIGGDEFVVLLEEITGAGDAAGVAARVLARLAAPYFPDGEALQPSASIGIAVTGSPAQSPDSLISHADAAMYRAKHAGRGRYEIFDATAYAAGRADILVRDRLATALRTAVREGQLELHYQPILDLREPRGSAAGEPAPSGPVHAVEALLRWHHPERGLLTAAEFIDAAESSGAVVELGAWVLSTACRQLAAWDEALGARAPGRVFVNISAAELSEPTLVHRVADALAVAALAPHRLTLEITETGLVTTPQGVAVTARAVRQLGCELAIDDFGTGYSSLSRLVQIPASTLKVDGSFSRNLLDSPDATAVISAVLRLGDSLQRTVVVEGVEDARTLAALRELGCTLVQGYHLGVPQHADSITSRLRQGTGRAG